MPNALDCQGHFPQSRPDALSWPHTLPSVNTVGRMNAPPNSSWVLPSINFYWNSPSNLGPNPLLFFFFFFSFWPCLTTCRILAPMPSAVKAQSLNHWTSREVPPLLFFKLSFLQIWSLEELICWPFKGLLRMFSLLVEGQPTSSIPPAHPDTEGQV